MQELKENFWIIWRIPAVSEQSASYLFQNFNTVCDSQSLSKTGTGWLHALNYHY